MINDEIKTVLDEQIVQALYDLQTVEEEVRDKQAATVEKLITARVRIDEQELKEGDSLAEYAVKRKVNFLEVLKIAAPIAGATLSTVIAAVVHNRQLNKVLQFETTGSVVSMAGKTVVGQVLK